MPQGDNLKKRLFDIFLALILIALAAPIMMIIATGIVFTSSGGALFWSKRIGRGNITFMMPKFRTMRIGSPLLATHLISNSSSHITRLGSFLRKSSLDELPQLWSILIGDMSFVGPRPALFNQHDLISLRIKYGVDKILPGLTGWAQVNGRDNLSVEDKVRFDLTYLERKCFIFDLKIICMTFLNVLSRKGISH